MADNNAAFPAQQPPPPTPLESATCDFFGQQGALAQADAHYRQRPGQLQMAQAVARTLQTGGALVVEAGTGVGKTWAYLVPVLLSGQRALISTATKALQDQLFNRDLPYLRRLLGLPLRVALLKGRASYICLHRLQQALHGSAGAERYTQHVLGKIERFAARSTSGDLSELDGLDERSPAIALATSTRENCLGNQCADFKRCFVHQARREALAADVVVINHHLFFADLAVRESGMAELLPSVQAVVFDEAHQLNEIGVQFLGKHLSTSHILDFARDLLAGGLEHARGLADWLHHSTSLQQATRDMRLVVGEWPPGSHLRWTDTLPEGVDPHHWNTARQALQQALTHAQQALEAVRDTAPDLARLHERSQHLLQRLCTFDTAVQTGFVRWVEIANTTLRLMQSPLDIADTVQERLLSPPDISDTPDTPEPASTHTQATQTTQDAPPAHQRAYIFTSATLGEDPHLRWFTQPCGLSDAPTLRVPSPFDYPRHAALYVPVMPLPGHSDHITHLIALVAQAASTLGGRTLVLTTTLRNLRAMGDGLRTTFANTSTAPEVLVQGERSKRQLVEQFRQGNQGSNTPGCVLVASASFWEGIDIPGNALQLVVIDKLPFPPPNDPVVEARCTRLNTQGHNPFIHYHLPEAAIMLKQGAGRLIRHETDTGILVIADSRLRHKNYGARLLAALPPMPHLMDADAFAHQLAALVQQRQQD